MLAARKMINDPRINGADTTNISAIAICILDNSPYQDTISIPRFDEIKEQLLFIAEYGVPMLVR